MRIPLAPFAMAIVAISTASCAAPTGEEKEAADTKAVGVERPAKAPTAQSTEAKNVPFVYDDKVDTETSNLEEAFEAAFNVPAGQTGASLAKVEMDNGTYVFKPVALYRIDENSWVLLSGGQSDNDGHAATGVNAVHYLTPAEGGWKATAKLVGFGSTGTWGNPATEWKFTRSLGKNPYLLTSAGGTWQGCSQSTMTLTELTPTGAKDRGSFIDANSWADGPGGINFDYEAAIINAVPDKSFTVRYKGTKSAEVAFERQGDTYVATSEVLAEGC